MTPGRCVCGGPGAKKINNYWTCQRCIDRTKAYKAKPKKPRPTFKRGERFWNDFGKDF